MDGNRADWLESMVEQHARMVFATAYRILGRADDAEDVLQDVFLKIVASKNGPALGSIRDWGAYLRTMAARTAIDLVRHRQRPGRETISASRLDLVAGQEDPQRLAVQKHRAGQLRQALRELSARDALVFTLRYLEDMSYDQIAAQMDLSVNQIGVILHRTRKRLREILEQMGITQGESW